jgi:hypothetical protein
MDLTHVFAHLLDERHLDTLVRDTLALEQPPAE